jgi:hypothetical protein
MEQNKNTTPIDPQMLIELVRMPFGKYKNRILCDLPEPYLVWFHRKGFPPGKIGMLLSALYEIKLNGVDTHGQARGTSQKQASLDALRAIAHSPTGKPVELCPSGL